MKWIVSLLAGFCAVTAVAAADTDAYDTTRPEIKTFIERMSREHGFDAGELGRVLSQARRQQSIIDAISRPAEKVLSWPEYRERFITEKRIADGVQFWSEHREVLEQVERESGVPAKFVVAIVGVETFWGRITGRYRVIDALSTLAFEYPPRSGYFTKELEQYLLLVREEGLDPLQPLGSYAGAMGPPQFMPRSVRQYAVDGDGDGKRDLWSNWHDILASVAHYLKVHGWKADEETTAEAPPPDAPADAKPSGSHNFGVIMRYNRSPLYAMAVYELAEAIAGRIFSDEQARTPLPLPAGDEKTNLRASSLPSGSASG